MTTGRNNTATVGPATVGPEDRETGNRALPSFPVPRYPVPRYPVPRYPVWRYPGRAGFTLLELILVLAVIAAVLAVSAPALRGFVASRQTADAAMRMLSMTRFARSEAMAKGQPHRLNLDSAGRSCWLTVQVGGVFVPVTSEAAWRFSLPEGATASIVAEAQTQTPSFVQFDPNGRSDEATIQIKGRAGEVFQIAAPSATESFRIIAPSEAKSS